MRVLVFTKPFGAMAAAELSDTLAAVGADGADVVIRDGQTVTPAAPGTIGDLARELERNDLSVELATTDLVDTGPEADRIFGACGEIGVRLARVGFFRYDPQRGYQHCLEQARRGLAGLVRAADRHGVRLALQLHHGTIHPSAALALRLSDEVLYYADPGNQAKEGSEDWRLNLDLLGDRIACMGVKNASWQGSSVAWQPFADGGVVAWPDIIAGLRERGHDIPLSLHVHYATDDARAAVKRDVAHLRDLLAKG